MVFFILVLRVSLLLVATLSCPMLAVVEAPCRIMLCNIDVLLLVAVRGRRGGFFLLRFRSRCGLVSYFD